jgi:hypothetical protein
MPTKDLEAQPHHTPVLRKAGAGIVLVIAAAIVLKVAIGMIMAVFWTIVAIAAVVGVIWALKTILW